jgi:uncharacterized protein YvpB
MYSAIRAEVPVSNDETTLENKDLLMQFRLCKKVNKKYNLSLIDLIFDYDKYYYSNLSI